MSGEGEAPGGKPRSGTRPSDDPADWSPSAEFSQRGPPPNQVLLGRVSSTIEPLCLSVRQKCPDSMKVQRNW